MTITLTAKETQDYAEQCRKWGKERAVVYTRALNKDDLVENPELALSTANKVAETWEKANPFPSLLSIS